MAKKVAESETQKQSFFRRLLKWSFRLVFFYLAFCLISIVYLRFFNPIVTAVHIERFVEHWIADEDYDYRFTPVTLSEIDDDLEHAVVSAEDGRFFVHNGVDWDAVQDVYDEYKEKGRLRGASTITQQLVKNVFFTTDRSYVRKALEVPLAYLADWIIPKDRILELYLNIVEWGPGTFGIEEASRRYYRKSAASLTRNESARLAACLPAPRSRRPQQMNRYSRLILQRMKNSGY